MNHLSVNVQFAKWALRKRKYKNENKKVLHLSIDSANACNVLSQSSYIELASPANNKNQVVR